MDNIEQKKVFELALLKNLIIGIYSIKEETDKDINPIYELDSHRLIIQKHVCEIDAYLLGQHQILTLRIA